MEYNEALYKEESMNKFGQMILKLCSILTEENLKNLCVEDLKKYI